jgi:hypothetical protein
MNASRERSAIPTWREYVDAPPDIPFKRSLTRSRKRKLPGSGRCFRKTSTNPKEGHPGTPPARPRGTHMGALFSGWVTSASVGAMFRSPSTGPAFPNIPLEQFPQPREKAQLHAVIRQRDLLAGGMYVLTKYAPRQRHRTTRVSPSASRRRRDRRRPLRGECG